MKQFKSLNNILGILVGVIATIVYSMTMESTASLWDCGEFIASAYKMQVVHPPGAPLFLMLGRMFTLIPEMMGRPDLISVSVNFMSALSSGLAMMFLFWITTYMGRKIVIGRDGEYTSANMYVILAAGLIAGLTGTFLDTVWFSAVEGEVYSMSLLFTAAVFWAICKWETIGHEPYADRWLVLIAFLMGCSIFVHWLNMLTIPAMGLVYYFKRYENPTFLGIIITLVISVGILGFMLQGVITGLIDVISMVEIFMVNSLGMPFNSGLVVSIIGLVAILTSVLFFAYKKNYPVIFNMVLAYTFVVIGFSTITTVPIRSIAGPAIDMNSPQDPVSLASYLHREQYGSRPLAFGYYYTDSPTGTKTKGNRYKKVGDSYKIVGKKFDYEYGRAKKKFFPRIHSRDHKKLYEKWLGLKSGRKPSFSDNIKFFWKYQIGHMYIRYFMWNFVGRQNEQQGTVDKKNGNWISGVPVSLFENGFIPSSDNDLPKVAKNNPYRNTFYFLPFLLGLLGLVFQAMNDKRRFLVVLFLFLMTGVALTIYGNSPPIEPRERDYIFAGSFWAFSIWVGLGVIALYSLLQNVLKGTAGVAVAFGISLIVPILLGAQGWDEHDRSGRYAAREYARNYLESCAPNAILFTQGDNDTYPLWYAQEVEGIRTDIHVVNLSLLGVDWYINQKRRKVNNAPIVPFSLSADQIGGSNRDMVLFHENPSIAPAGKHINLQEIMKFIGNDNNKQRTQSGDEIAYYPTKTFSLPVDKAKVLANGTVAAKDASKIVDKLEWTLGKKTLLKNDLMVLDIIASNNWENPIYFAVSVDRKSYMGLAKYFQLEGLAYRLVPIENPQKERTSPFLGRVDTDIMYDNLMNKFQFGNIGEEGVYLSNDIARMASNFRSNYVTLAEALLDEGKKDKAIAVLDRCQKEMPNHNNPYNLYTYPLALAYYRAGANEKGNAVAEILIDNLADEVKYYAGMDDDDAKRFKRDKDLNIQYIRQFISLAKQNGQTEFAKKIEEKMAGF